MMSLLLSQRSRRNPCEGHPAQSEGGLTIGLFLRLQGFGGSSENSLPDDIGVQFVHFRNDLPCRCKGSRLSSGGFPCTGPFLPPHKAFSTFGGELFYLSHGHRECHAELQVGYVFPEDFPRILVSDAGADDADLRYRCIPPSLMLGGIGILLHGFQTVNELSS